MEVLGEEVDLEVDGFDVTLEPEFTWVLEILPAEENSKIAQRAY